MKDKKFPTQGSKGVTFTELMVATVILTVGILGLLSSLAVLQRGIQLSKNKTLGGNLAQEKMQIIKQMNYYKILPTQSPAFTSDGTPYDNSYFIPETILEGGVAFIRYTYVQVVAEDPGTHVLNILPPTTPDTGMRQVTVTLYWKEGNQTKSYALNSVFSNPNTVEANSIFNGVVENATTGNPINHALATVAENVGWRDSTNASGLYTINLMPGSFNLVASAPGYFPQSYFQSVTANHTTTYNFSLTQMSSGTISGTAWLEPNVVVSQVVISTRQSNWNNYNAQYIELFNPTNSPVLIGSGGTPNINVNFATSGSCGQKDDCSNGLALIYVSTVIPANGYYLIASTPSLIINGNLILADAYYDNANLAANCLSLPANWNPSANPSHNQIMPWDFGSNRSHSGSLWLTDASNNVLDTVGWEDAQIPPKCGGGNSGCMQLSPYPGFQDGWQLVRLSSPTLFSNSVGRAYNSGTNTVDFSTFSAIGYIPFSSNPTPTVQPNIAGVPAFGAIVTASDGLSGSTRAYSSGYPPVAKFSLINVASGTWTVLITSNSFELENDTVTITTSGSTYIFPSSTTFLNGTATQGFIAGTVLDPFLHPISAPSAITVSPGLSGASTVADPSTGRYILRVTSGSVDITANPNNGNANFISVSSLAVPSYFGQITDNVNFILSQGGQASGYVTRDGINALPGITVTAIDANGYARDTQVTDVYGRFKTINMATGTYTLQPSLDVLEASTPTAISANITAGSNVFVGTYTISGALGSITGQVTSGGLPIQTGVLIVATTSTLAGTPPDVPAISASAAGVTYLTSSQENGTYTLNVRQSTSPAYNVYGYFYPTVSSMSVTTPQWTKLSNIGVTAGVTTSGVNFAW